MASLRLKDFSLKKGATTLIHNLSFQIEPDQILCLMGPSGVGKSSLLLYLAGLLQPPLVGKGTIFLGPEPIQDSPAHLRKLGLLFQEPLLFPHLNVEQNLLFAIPNTIKNRKPLVEQALQTCGLVGFNNRKVDSLSGGQKARVSLFRTLLSAPQAVLLDEPFNKFDRGLKEQIQAFFLEHIKAMKLPCLFVTHDECEAQTLSNQIIYLDSPIAALPNKPQE